MKKVLVALSAGLFLFSIVACTSAKDRYLDLSTGNPVELEKDEATGLMVNSETKQPVYIYVDTKSNDTIYGKTGKVINGHVVRTDDNRYVFDADENLGENSMKYKDGDYKVKVEDDGDIKIKDGDDKTKIDGESGERKVKND